MNINNFLNVDFLSEINIGNQAAPYRAKYVWCCKFFK